MKSLLTKTTKALTMRSISQVLRQMREIRQGDEHGGENSPWILKALKKAKAKRTTRNAEKVKPPAEPPAEPPKTGAYHPNSKRPIPNPEMVRRAKELRLHQTHMFDKIRAARAAARARRKSNGK